MSGPIILGINDVVGHLQKVFCALHACITKQQSRRTINLTKKRLSEAHIWKYNKILVRLQITTLRTEHLSFIDLFQLQKLPFLLQPQHSACCPLNRTIIMKTVILAILMFLAVSSIVSGAPVESDQSGYGHETCLVVILQTLKC